MAIEPLLHESNVGVANLMSTLKTVEEHEDPSEVKVVDDKNNVCFVLLT